MGFSLLVFEFKPKKKPFYPIGKLSFQRAKLNLQVSNSFPHHNFGDIWLAKIESLILINQIKLQFVLWISSILSMTDNL